MALIAMRQCVRCRRSFDAAVPYDTNVCCPECRGENPAAYEEEVERFIPKKAKRKNRKRPPPRWEQNMDLLDSELLERTALSEREEAALRKFSVMSK